jgi:hypothetical protein
LELGERSMSNVHKLPNLGYLLDDVPQEVLNALNAEMDSLNEDTAIKANETLAGNIKKEYFLETSKSIVEEYVLGLANDYHDNYYFLESLNFKTTGRSLPIKLGSLWVNYQEKGEFNPHHKHTGILSFVIWIKIPYDIRDEKESSPGMYSNTNSAGYFEFIYNDILGNTQSYQIPADNSFEGKILMFPNMLMHGVYPFFTSEEYRISVSGNIIADIGEK